MAVGPYRLILSYRGGAYAGWQRQPDAVTVQQRVEEALAALGLARPRVVAAGRTDAGVHARAQAAHLDTPEEPSLRSLIHGTNHHLPDDIRVIAAARMGAGFDARRSARSKLYVYRMVPTRVLSPLDALDAISVRRDLDLDAMRRALAALPGRHDFSAFALSGGAHRDPHRRIFGAELASAGGLDEGAVERLELRLEGEGFLRGMVRSIAGTLLEVGAGTRDAAAFAGLLAGAPRSAAGPTAPAAGLTLEWVDYGPSWRPLEELDTRRG